jgi:predicted DNA-binding protein (UPF0251 family)
MVGDGSVEGGDSKPKKRKPGNPGTPRRGYHKGKLEDTFIQLIDYKRSKKDPRYYDKDFLKRLIYSIVESPEFPEDEREVFLLKFELKKDGEEIAEIIGYSKTIVSRRLASAVLKVKRCLSDPPIKIYFIGGVYGMRRV